MLSKMTIGKKLMTAFGAMLVIAIGLVTSSLYSIGGLGKELDKAVNLTAKKILSMEEMRVNLVSLRYSLRGAMLYAMHNEPGKAASNQKDFAEEVSRLNQIIKEVKPLLVTDRGRNDVAVIEGEVAKMKSSAEGVFAAADAGRHKEALAIAVDQFVKSYEVASTSAVDLIDLQKGLLEESIATSAQKEASAYRVAWILLGLAALITPLAYFTIRSTTKSLRAVTWTLAQGSVQIASAASQVASSSQTLAQGASEQAASLEETSASSEQITSMTRKNAENSASSASMMSEVDEHVQHGNQTLERMVSSMQAIHNSSDKISKIIKVIDEIAFQTNILALNAAVEAARAGEAGMGFAVVADEVRNLAQRSAQAAKDTTALIEESILNSNEGGGKLQEVAQVMSAITGSTGKVKTLVDEVNLGSQEQAKGIEQISKAIAQMDQVTQSTAASAEESASASEELSAQAEALNTIVVQLRSLVGGEEVEARKA